MLSDEVDNFVRVIKIDSEAKFFELHNAILDSVNYEKNQMTSFFICSDNWEKGQEVTLVEMESSSEYDNLTMDVAPKAVIDEEFYGDQDYEVDELDEEGFGEMNFDDSSLFAEDPKF